MPVKYNSENDQNDVNIAPVESIIASNALAPISMERTTLTNASEPRLNVGLELPVNMLLIPLRNSQATQMNVNPTASQLNIRQKVVVRQLFDLLGISSLNAFIAF